MEFGSFKKMVVTVKKEETSSEDEGDDSKSLSSRHKKRKMMKGDMTPGFSEFSGFGDLASNVEEFKASKNKANEEGEDEEEAPKLSFAAAVEDEI